MHQDTQFPRSRFVFATTAVALLAGLFLALLCLGLGGMRPVHAETAVEYWAVCPESPSNGCDYPTVQQAVDAAGPGAVIRVVGNNSYAENVIITKSLTLLGGCANAACAVRLPGVFVTTLDGGRNGRVVAVRGEDGAIDVTVDGFVITGGDATDEDDACKGGGVASWQAALVLARNTITGNLAARGGTRDGFGGGVYAYSSTIALSHNQVLSNQASSGDDGYGGGVYLELASGFLADNLLRDNLGTSGTGSNAYGWGGGLYAEDCDVLTLTQNALVSNTASVHDTGYGGGGSVKEGRAFWEENTVRENLGSRHGRGYGGGLRLVEGDFDLSHNWIVSNTASIAGSGGGGGVYLSDASATMEADVLLANIATVSPTADAFGSGLLAYPGVVTLTNAVVARNGLVGQGEGLYLSSAGGPLTVTLFNSTIVSNTRRGIACLGSDLHVSLVNLIVWGNEDDLYGCEGADLAYSDVEDAGDTGTGVIHQPPRFSDPAADDYHLRADSPCLDVAAGPALYPFVPQEDWDGETRPAGNGYDMGADELWPTVFLPLMLREYE